MDETFEQNIASQEEIQRLGEELAQLTGFVNQADVRLKTKHDTVLAATGTLHESGDEPYETLPGGYWQVPPVHVRPQSAPGDLYEVMLNRSNSQGGTEKIAEVKHGSSDAEFVFPNIPKQLGYMEELEGYKEEGKATSPAAQTIQVRDSLAWREPSDGSRIPPNFRLTYLIDQNGNIKPLYPEAADPISSSTMEELRNMTAALKDGLRTVMGGNVQLVEEDNTLEATVVSPIEVVGGF
jgi:hypothetical protein